jgi:thiol-disulfide isomerase/thioredoxin
VQLPLHTVVAFHPFEPLYASAEVDFNRSETLDNLTLQLKREGFPSLIERFDADLTPWHRGILTECEKERVIAESRVGKPAPELDGAHWLNTEKPTASLADFRGKYVLLQFWTTWCGPCHEEFPSLKLLDQLYRDPGLVVVGVHDNSMPLSSIEADVAKNALKYPIVVDHADGRIVAGYKVSGFPTYVLIGPDGNIVIDENTPGPSLRSFGLEIARKILWSQR